MKSRHTIRNPILATLICLLTVAHCQAQWATTRLAVPRRGLTALGADGRVFFGGGIRDSVSRSANSEYVSSIYQQVVEVYNVTTQSWEQAGALGWPRNEGIAGVSAGYVCFLGGYSFTGNTWISTMDATDAQLPRDWENKVIGVSQVSFPPGHVPLPFPFDRIPVPTIVDQPPQYRDRNGAAGVNVGDRIILAGGFDGQALSAEVDYFAFNSQPFVTIGGPLSEARTQLAAAAAGGKAFFAGGFIFEAASTDLTLVPSMTVDILDLASGAWSVASLSVPRGNLAGASAAGKVFFAGGKSFNTASDAVDIYDTATGRWSVAKLSQARWNMAVAVAGNKVYFAGGQTGSGPSDAVDIYDFVADVWMKAKLSVARTKLAGASVGSVAFFAGGSETGDSNSSSLRVIDVCTPFNNASPPAKLSQARAYLAATSAGGKLFFAGGQTYSGGIATGAYSNVVDIYTPATQTWSRATLSEPRSALAATSTGGKAFFAGGNGDSGPSYAVDVYDTATNQWSTASLSVARASLAAAGAGSKVLFGGGLGAFLSVSDAVDIYDTATNRWTVAALSQARSDLAAASAGGRIFFAGGGSATGYSDVVDIYDAATGQWTIAKLSQARSGLTATTLGSKVYFIGGVSEKGNSNQIDVYDTATNQWSTTTLAWARNNHAVTTAGGRFVVGGGAGAGSTPTAIVEFGGGLDWVESLSVPREGLVAIADGNVAYFAGGATRGAYSDAVDSYVIPTTSRVAEPAIQRHPSPGEVNACVGQNVVGRVEASGDYKRFQWYKSTTGNDRGVPVTGQITATLKLDSVKRTDAGTYYCRIVNDSGETWSNAFRLTVSATSFTSPPSPATGPVCAGQAIRLAFGLNCPDQQTFNAQLSDASGSFAAPTDLGRIAPGTAQLVVPPTTPTGTGYRLRIVSNQTTLVSPVSLPVWVVGTSDCASTGSAQLLVSPNPLTGGTIRCWVRGLIQPVFSLTNAQGRPLDATVEMGLQPGEYVLKPRQRLIPSVYVLAVSRDTVRLNQRVLVVE